MKEATGELNMTVVTVVAIAAVAAFFYAFVWPAIKNNINRNTLCATAYGCDSKNQNCHYIDEQGAEHDGLDCAGQDVGTTNGNNGNGNTNPQ